MSYGSDIPFWVMDYIGLGTQPKQSESEKKKIDESMVKLEKCLNDFYEAGGETLTTGIRDGKYVMLNQRGEISSKITYEEYMSNIRKEFASLVESNNNKK